MKSTKFKIGDLICPKKDVAEVYCLPGTYLYVSDEWKHEDGTVYRDYFLTLAGDGTFTPFHRGWAEHNMEMVSA